MKGVIFSAKGKNTFSNKQLNLLTSLSEITFYEVKSQLDSQKLFEVIQDNDFAALTPRSYSRLSKEQIQALRLKAIHLPTTGIHWFEPERFNNIDISFVPNFSSIACAEFTWSLILLMIRSHQSFLSSYNLDLHASKPGIELAGKTLGIWGLGNIGKRVAKYANCFEMEVLGYDKENKEINGVKQVSLEEMLEKSDIITIHIPINKSNHKIINKEIIDKLKEKTVLINTSRPKLMDYKALEEGLKNSKLKAVAIDKGYETQDKFRHLLKYDNFVLTPHISWYTRESIEREINGWFENIYSWLAGKPINIYNGQYY
ncbi:MAG: hypothetical protein CME66_02390 [Halobacteriovoraceae bacterium]|nr:hypothetical protein [Halobacteriovoraceae bacterium]